MLVDSGTRELNFATDTVTVPLGSGGLSLSRMSFINADGIDGNDTDMAAANWQVLASGLGIDALFRDTGLAGFFRSAHAATRGDGIARSVDSGAVQVRPRLQDILLPVLFFSAIGLVLACTDWSGRGNGVAEQENRQAAQRPPMPRSFAELASYPERFGAFFADHFGLRRQMVALRGRIGLRLQHKSPSPDVIVGTHGWLFFAGNRSLDNYLHQVPLSAAELDDWARRIAERRAWFAAHGITYLFVVAPDKQSIYPEYMPRVLQPPPGDTRLDQLSQRLANEPAWLDLRPMLRAAKPQGQLYFRGDTHWNDLGAYYGYRAIMRRLGLDPLPRDERLLAHSAHPDDLVRMSGLMETEPDAVFPMHCAALQPPTFDAALLDQQHHYGTPAYNIPATRCPAGDERLLIFQDSFVQPMWPYLSDTFARVVYVWRQPSLKQMQAMAAVEHPTVVIEERVERYLVIPLVP